MQPKPPQGARPSPPSKAATPTHAPHKATPDLARPRSNGAPKPLASEVSRAPGEPPPDAGIASLPGLD